MIKLFKDFHSSVEADINHYIDEAMSVSFDVHQIVQKIEDLLMDENNILYIESDIKEFKTTKFRYLVNPKRFIVGKECEFNLTFINVEDDIPPEQMRAFCRKYSSSKVDRIGKSDNEYIDYSYRLTATVVLNNMTIDRTMRSILAHELKHIFVHIESTKNGDVEPGNWDKIYGYCEHYLKNCDKYGKEFYKVIYALYSCDKEKIDEFTQQAYEDCCDCKSSDDIKKRMKYTELWDIIYKFNDALNILSKEGYGEKFNAIRRYVGVDNLPSASYTASLIRKRYKKAYSNYGKVLMMLIDDLDEGLVETVRTSLNYKENKYWI